MLEHTVRRLGELMRTKQALIAAALLVLLVATGATMTRKEVVLVVDGEARTVKSWRSTVDSFLKQEQVELCAEDRVEPALNSVLRDGAVVEVKRAFEVIVCVGGVATGVKTAQDTVGQVLMDLGVFVGSRDRLTPAAVTAAEPGQEISVVRIVEREFNETCQIPYNVQRRQDGDLEIGQTKLVQAGTDGLLERRVRQVLEDGEAVQEQIVAETIVQEAVPQIVAVGTMGTLSRGGSDYRYSRMIEAVATAYCPTDVGGNVTATGAKTRRGIVAVDPRVIPLGTRLYVENYGPALAADVGGAIKGNRVDIFVESHQEAVSWGRRKVKVYVLK